MNRPVRTLALSATAALALSGCSLLPFEIVPKGQEPSPSAEEATPTEEVSTEEVETQVEVEETPADEPAANDEGPTYSVHPEDALSQVVNLCNLPNDILLDDGMTMVLDNPGEDPDSGDMTPEQSGCVLGALEMPDWVQEEISSTTAMDGRQRAVDGYVTWSWTFSAGEGLDFLITVSEDEG